MIYLNTTNKTFMRKFLRRNPDRNKFNNIFSGNYYILNIYEFHILVEYTQNKYGEFMGFETQKLKSLIKFIDKLYFVCGIDFINNSWSLDYIFFDAPLSKTFLMKKTVMHELDYFFTNIKIDNMRSNSYNITIFNPEC